MMIDDDWDGIGVRGELYVGLRDFLFGGSGQVRPGILVGSINPINLQVFPCLFSDAVGWVFVVVVLEMCIEVEWKG